MRFLLLHGPAVGPATWRWVAEALRTAGHEAVVPDLRAEARAGVPTQVADASARAAAGDDVVVVGHSGAGGLLPLVMPGARLLFIDAGIPPAIGPYSLGGTFTSTLRGLAVCGVLPPWSTWFGEHTMEELVSDGDRRQRVAAELPEVPLALYEGTLDAPGGWRHGRHAYVLLSEAYREDAALADELGWQVEERLGGHLDIVNDDESIAALLIDVGGR